MKVKPEIKRKSYPLLFADIELKRFDIKSLHRGCGGNTYLEKIIFNSIPEIKYMVDLVRSHYDFNNDREFLMEYLNSRGKKMPKMERYLNDEDIFPRQIEMHHKLKKQR